MCIESNSMSNANKQHVTENSNKSPGGPCHCLISLLLCVDMVLATAFLEFWKRREAIHQYDWDISKTDEVVENIRPQYEMSVKYRKINPVTQVLFIHSPGFNLFSLVHT